MDPFKYAVMVLLLAACAGDGPPKSGAVANLPNQQQVAPSPGSAMTQPPATHSPPKTTIEQVERWAPNGASVVDVRSRGEADLDLAAGVDVFMLTVPSQGRPVADGRSKFSIVAIAGGVGNPILQDKAAILAAVAKTNKDPQKLACVGLLLDGRDDTPLTSASTDEQRKAGVKAPAIVKNAIEFWIASGSPARNLYHCSLDRSTAALSVGAAPIATSNNVVVDDAASALQSGNPAAMQVAFDALATACSSNPGAKKLLLEILANHAREDARAAAAFSAPKCGHAALAPLITALEHDKSRIVRGKVAFALAELGDKSAIPALEKATTSDIASAAGIALEQLKKK
jgi:hypothetical protein